MLALEHLCKYGLSLLLLRHLVSDRHQKLLEGTLVHNSRVIGWTAPLDICLLGGYTPLIHIQRFAHFLFEDLCKILALYVFLNLHMEVSSINAFLIFLHMLALQSAAEPFLIPIPSATQDVN